jgi:hypothetical protein
MRIELWGREGKELGATDDMLEVLKKKRRYGMIPA